jgi:protein TonB
VLKTPDKSLSESALKAVRTWRYRPYLLNGDPVEVDTAIHVVYNLGD